MIAFVRGILDDVSSEFLTLDVQGVGYQVLAHDRLRDEMKSQRGQEVKILTHLIHREDQMSLVGFLDTHEKEVFLQLIKVSGVGARTAIGMISALSAQDIVQAVASNQPKILKNAPGVGLKTAQRIILELREKLSKLNIGPPVVLEDGILSTQDQEEIELALLTLGYSQEEIYLTIDKHSNLLKNSSKFEDMLRIMLEKLSG